MPFKDLRYPPIQLGILEQSLRSAGIAARSHSMELLFMEQLRAYTALTIGDYQAVAHQDFGVQLGDWIFCVPPYADPDPELDERYLAYVRDRHQRENAIENAIEMKRHVPAFLESARDEILAEQPRIVGFSTVFQQNVASLALARALKMKEPSLTIIFGGDNCDGVMGAALHESFPWVDFVIRGEGEHVLVEVSRDILADRAIRPQAGLCQRIGGRSVALSPDDQPRLAMDKVPAPVYDEFFDRLDRSPLRNELRANVSILFESSRGCWWGAKSHCTFCGLNPATMAFRSKPADRVATEILELARRHKVLSFVAVDDIIDLAHIHELLPIIANSGCDLEIYYETKANLTKEQLHSFLAAGVDRMQPGIESLSTPILKLMRKGVTALQNIRLLKWSAELGITPDWNLIYGFPGEPPEAYGGMADLIPSLVHLQAPNFTRLAIQRFSPYFERPQDFGLELVGPMPSYEFLYSIAPDALRNIAYEYDYHYTDGRDPSDYIGRTAEAVRSWRDARGAESLVYRRGPGFLIVHDRRPGLQSADYEFDDVEAAIYLACDAGTTADGVRRQLLSAGVADPPKADEIEDYLLELTDARLLYREDNRFLSLAIAPPPTSRVRAPGGASLQRVNERRNDGEQKQ